MKHQITRFRTSGSWELYNLKIHHLGIKLDKSRKAESKSPLSNQQNTTCNEELSNTAGTFAAFLHSIFQDFQGFRK